MGKMSIGQLALRSGVGVETLRYYERRGLLAPAARRANGYRTYGTSELRRMMLIRAAKSLAFTLGEIRQFVDQIERDTCGCSQLRVAADAKLDELDHQIAQLQHVRRQLRALRSRCGGAERADCPVVSEMTIEPSRTHS
jgi:MerR family transcriptional regulator, copper efflux regulator